MNLHATGARGRLLALLLLAGCGVGGALPAVAAADTEVHLSGSQLVIEGSLLQRQNTNVSLEDGFYRVREANSSGPRVDPGAGCTRINLRDASCSASGIAGIKAFAHDLDDRVAL